MTRLFYQIEDQILFDQKAFLDWAARSGFYSPEEANKVQIEWIDRSGLIHVN